MYSATTHMLSRWHFAPSSVCMHAHAITVTRKTQRQTTRHIDGILVANLLLALWILKEKCSCYDAALKNFCTV